MAASSRATVDTTAGGTAIILPGTYIDGAEVIVRNRGSVAVYLGASGVTTSTGFQLDPSESVSFRLARAESLYGITGSSSAVVHVLKMNRAEKGVDT